MNTYKFKVGDLVYIKFGDVPRPEGWYNRSAYIGFIKELECGPVKTNKYDKALVTLINGRSAWYPTSFIGLKS